MPDTGKEHLNLLYPPPRTLTLIWTEALPKCSQKANTMGAEKHDITVPWLKHAHEVGKLGGRSHSYKHKTSKMPATLALLSRDVATAILQPVEKLELKNAIPMNDGHKQRCDESSSFKGNSLQSSALLWIFTSVKCQIKTLLNTILFPHPCFNLCLIILPVQIFLLDNLSKTF